MKFLDYIIEIALSVIGLEIPHLHEVVAVEVSNK